MLTCGSTIGWSGVLILRLGQVVEMAKGIMVVREQVAALLSGKAPGGGRGDKDAGGPRGGGGVVDRKSVV